MAVSISVPNLGPEMAGGLVAEWYVPDGAPVGAGDLICRFECEFVAVEIEADAPGLLRQQAAAGSIERVDAVIGMITSPGEAVPDSESAPVCAGPAPATPPVTEHHQHAGAVPEPAEPTVVPFRRGPREAADADRRPSEKVQPLEDAGTAIPGLPLWEPDEDPPFADAFPAGVTAGHVSRFIAVAAEASAGAEALTMELRLDAAQALRAVGVLAWEWHELEPPIVEDLVLRAFARALGESGLDSSPAGLTRITLESDHAVAIRDASERGFREAVGVRAAGGDTAADRAAWWLLSLRETGVLMGQPPLDAGHALAASIGAIDESGWMSVTMAYDSSRLGPGEAARILARVRRLVEEPYGLLSS